MSCGEDCSYQVVIFFCGSIKLFGDLEFSLYLLVIGKKKVSYKCGNLDSQKDD